MNTSCYSCRESIKRLKLHKKHIIEKHYDRTGVDDISVFYPDIPLPMVFDKFKENLRAGILKGKFDRRLRRLIYPFASISSWVRFQFEVDNGESNIVKPAVCVWYAPLQDALTVVFLCPEGWSQFFRM